MRVDRQRRGLFHRHGERLAAQRRRRCFRPFLHRNALVSRGRRFPFRNGFHVIQRVCRGRLRSRIRCPNPLMRCRRGLNWGRRRNRLFPTSGFRVFGRYAPFRLEVHLQGRQSLVLPEFEGDGQEKQEAVGNDGDNDSGTRREEIGQRLQRGTRRVKDRCVHRASTPEIRTRPRVGQWRRTRRKLHGSMRM